MKVLLSLSILFLSVPAFSATFSVVLTNQNNPNEKVSDAVVAADPLSGQAPRPPIREYDLAQKNKNFVPHVLAIGVGSRVRFPNEDPFSHSVYAVSPNKSFELALFKKNDPVPAPIVFEKPGRVVLGCNIHDTMVGYILVLDTPYFARSEGGAAKLELPPGKYRIRIWHPRMKEKEPVVVAASLDVAGDTKKTFNISLAEEKVKSNPFMPGVSYEK